jgi:3-oxoacyl-[acyl-carrier-protein] synthase II
MSRSTDPLRASIPFDKERDGFVIGEGAGVLVLESLSHALARGASVLAEVAGYGANCDAFHMTAPAAGGEGAALCMELALREAGIKPSDVDYINAHGTSTQLNDAAETLAVKAVFGEHASNLFVSSTKSQMGHLLGAAGAVEAIAAVVGITEGFAPPTAGYKIPDPECDLNYVVDGSVSLDINYALSNNFGFGGHNAVLCFKRWCG